MHRAEGTEAIHPMDFYPWHSTAPPANPEPQTPEELAAALRAMLNAKANPDGN